MSSKVKIEVDGKNRVIVKGEDSPEIKVSQPDKIDISSVSSSSINVTSINGDFTENITDQISVDNTDPGIGRSIGKTYSPGVPVESIVRDMLTSAVREPQIRIQIKIKEITRSHGPDINSGVSEFAPLHTFSAPFTAHVLHSMKFIVDDPDNALIDSEDLVIETNNLTTNPSLSLADLGLSSWSELDGHVIGLEDESDYEDLLDFNFQKNPNYPATKEDRTRRPYPGSFIDSWDLEEYQYNSFFTKVTLRVDTNDIDVPEGNVICAGGQLLNKAHNSSGNFLSSSNALVMVLEDVNGDGIYEGTFDFDLGDGNREYIFSNVPSSQITDGLMTLSDFLDGAEDISGQSCAHVVPVPAAVVFTDLPSEATFRRLTTSYAPQITVEANFGECSGTVEQTSARDAVYYSPTIEKSFRVKMKYNSSTGVKDVFSDEAKVVGNRVMHYFWNPVVNLYPPGSGVGQGVNPAASASPVFGRNMTAYNTGHIQESSDPFGGIVSSTRSISQPVTGEGYRGIQGPPRNVSVDQNENFGIVQGSEQTYLGDSVFYISVPIPYKIDLTQDHSIITSDGFPCADAFEFVGFMKITEATPILPWWPGGFWFHTMKFHRIYRAKQTGGVTYGAKLQVNLVVDHPVEGDTS